MKEKRLSRTSRDRSGHMSPDAERLIAAATGLAHSGSRAEDRYWERFLDARVDKLLDSAHGQSLYEAMERLYQTDLEAYGALVEATESAAEFVTVEHAQGAWDLLLLSIPVVAWTRFKIPVGALTAKQTKQLTNTLKDQVLAKGALVSLAPHLYSIDQMPRDFNEVRRWLRKHGAAALSESAIKLDTKDLPDSAVMLADSRYLLGVVAVNSGSEVFCWQESVLNASRANAPKERRTRIQSLEHWISAARPELEQVLAGCGFECLLPDAYHINLRESDRRVRPYAIKAGVNFLQYAMNVPSTEVKAIVAAFGEDRADEYRIGLTVGNTDAVYQGVMWPLFGPESADDDPSPLDEIREVLKLAGITQIHVWPEVSEPEFCEDCGAPLYPNLAEEMVHVESPEESEPQSQHFH